MSKKAIHTVDLNSPKIVKKLEITDDEQYIVTYDDNTIETARRSPCLFSLTSEDRLAISKLKPKKIIFLGAKLNVKAFYDYEPKTI